MKCDELKNMWFNAYPSDDADDGVFKTTLVYGKEETDEAIAELKARIHELENMPHTDNSAVIELLQNENKVLKDKLRHYPMMASIIESDKNELAELRDATRWRKVSEELPKIGEEIIFLAKYKTDSISKWLGDYRRDIFYTSCPGWGCEFLPSEILGWMPQPKAPEVK